MLHEENLTQRLSGRKDTLLKCADCGAEYSATPGDYWATDDADIFDCGYATDGRTCTGRLQEGTKREVFTPIREVRR